jgi:prepilin peptidase CpaA
VNADEAARMDLQQGLPLGVVTAAALAAGIIDLRTFKIPNRLTVPLLVSGVLYHLLLGSAGGLAASLTGAVFGFGIMFHFFLKGAMGAGDVKLLAAVGAWLGFPAVAYVFALAAFASAVCSVVILIQRNGLRRAIAVIEMQLGQWMALGKHAESGERVEVIALQADRRSRLIPFAVMVCLGVILFALWSIGPLAI